MRVWEALSGPVPPSDTPPLGLWLRWAPLFAGAPSFSSAPPIPCCSSPRMPSSGRATYIILHLVGIPPDCRAQILDRLAALCADLDVRTPQPAKRPKQLETPEAVAKPEAAAALRSVMPRTPFLLPGYGAQGGGADGVRAALDPVGSGVLVTASRSIIRAWQSSDADASSGESWTDAVSTAADRFIEEIAGVVDGSIA